MACDKSKTLAKRTQSDKFLRSKAFKIASDPKYDGYQRGLVLMVYRFSNKICSGRAVPHLLANKFATKPNYQITNELHRQIIKKI